MGPPHFWRHRATLRALVLLVAAAPRTWAAFADQGIFWPDEFYQSIEQAHRFAFGYGIVPWEFAEGARSWVFPGAIGVVWKAMAALGVSQAPTLIVTAKLLMVALSVAAVDWTMALAARLAAPQAPNLLGEESMMTGASVLAGTIVATFPALVFFGSKCMSETASAPALVGAALLVTHGTTRRSAWAGVAVGLATFLRYQNGVVALALLGVLTLERRWRDAVAYGLAGAAVALAGGLLDAAIWGRPFHSLLHYAHLHAQDVSSAWGRQPAGYYLKFTWTSAGPFVLVLIAGWLAAGRRRWPYLAVVLVYLLVHSAVPHKEYRFITPIVPLAAAVSAAGLAEVAARFRRPLVPLALAGLVSVAFLLATRSLTFWRMGHGDGLAARLAGARDSPWHAAEGINRLLWAAGARADLCGVVVHRIPWSSTGGFAYLHKDVPLLFELDGQTAPVANYVVARREVHLPTGYALEEESREFALFHRPGPCQPAPPSYTRVMKP